MSDPASDLVNHISEAETTRRRDLLERAATDQRWHDPSIAGRVIATDDVATTGDAATAVRAYTRAHPEHAGPAPISEAEQTQRWGREILDGLERGGR